MELLEPGFLSLLSPRGCGELLTPLCFPLFFFFFSLSLFQKVCTKCGIETVGAQKRPLWLCKICSEQREVKHSCGEMGLSSVHLPTPNLCRACVGSSLCLGRQKMAFGRLGWRPGRLKHTQW